MGWGGGGWSGSRALCMCDCVSINYHNINSISSEEILFLGKTTCVGLRFCLPVASLQIARVKVCSQDISQCIVGDLR